MKSPNRETEKAPLQKKVNKTKVFIGSSGEAKGLADILDKKLKSTRDIEPRFWKDRQFFPFGEHFLASLIRQGKECDLAIIFLTRDDLRIHRERAVYAASGNPVFEHGLFVGSLDHDSKRCIVVSDLEDHEIQSDFGSVSRVRIQIEKKDTTTSGDDLNDTEVCKKIMTENAIQEIISHIRDMNACPHPSIEVISRQELIRREQPTMDGDLIEEPAMVAVMVNCKEVPLETNDAGVAANVMANLRRDLKYSYFWENTKINWKHAVNMVVRIARNGNEGEASNLAIMKDHLNIHFRVNLGFQFCVHNACHPGMGLRCYLRHLGDTFIAWPDERTPDIMTEFELICDTCANNSGQGIFHSLAGAPLAQDIRAFIWSEMNKRFPDVGELEKICFG